MMNILQCGAPGRTRTDTPQGHEFLRLTRLPLRHRGIDNFYCGRTAKLSCYYNLDHSSIALRSTLRWSRFPYFCTIVNTRGTIYILNIISLSLARFSTVE